MLGDQITECLIDDMCRGGLIAGYNNARQAGRCWVMTGQILLAATSGGVGSGPEPKLA